MFACGGGAKKNTHSELLAVLLERDLDDPTLNEPARLEAELRKMVAE